MTGSADGRTDVALDALRAWLLTEHAYEAGGVPDEVLNYLQDHIGRLLGPRATSLTGDFLKADESLAELARDRDRLIELLAVIEGGRRRGFELQWTAGASRSDENATPTALLVMAEYGVDDPVWDRPVGHGGPVSLNELAVSESLVRRLREWNETFERSGFWTSGTAHRSGFGKD